MIPRLANGRFEARWLEAGTYVVEIASTHHASFSAQVELRAGERLVLDVPFEALPIGGMIAGRVVSETGSYAGQLLVFLRAEDGRVLEVSPLTWRERAGESEARFEFEEVPAGPCTLDVVSLRSEVQLTEPRPVVRAPADGLELVLRDRAPASDWAVEVVDADTGSGVADFDFAVSLAGGPARIFRHGTREKPWQLIVGDLAWNRFAGSSPLRALADDAVFTWEVRSPGYRTSAGGALAFDVAATGARRLRVELLAE